MPRSCHERKPILGRAGSVMLAVALVCAFAASAGATTKQQLIDAKNTLHRLEHQIHAAKIQLHVVKHELRAEQRTLGAMQARLNAMAVRVSQAMGAFENTRARVDATHHDLVTAQKLYRSLRSQIDQRARQLYELGPGSDLELLFGASSLSDLSDRMEFVGAVNAQAGSLADQTQRVAQGLRMKQARLVVLRDREHRQLATLRAQQAQLNGRFARQQALLSDTSSKQAEVSSLLSGLAGRETKINDLVGTLGKRLATQARARAERLARAAGNSSGVSNGSGGGSVTGHPFVVCPVNGPHAYSDSFGAPRYAGGYHPHAGNDILAPRGTPIVATFDGYASADPNGLGGNAVIVTGSQGYTYNAHLDRYGTLGQVSAGTVVGYVGDSGDAAGGPTHDHFEWHPNVLPSPLYRSAYGYTDIDGAIDPFPYLNQVC